MKTPPPSRTVDVVPRSGVAAGSSASHHRSKSSVSPLYKDSSTVTQQHFQQAQLDVLAMHMNYAFVHDASTAELKECPRRHDLSLFEHVLFLSGFQSKWNTRTSVMYCMRTIMLIFVACTVWLRIDALRKDSPTWFLRALMVSDIVYYVAVVCCTLKLGMDARVRRAWKKSHWMIPSRGPSGSQTYSPRVYRMGFMIITIYMLPLVIVREWWLINVYGVSLKAWSSYLGVIGEIYFTCLMFILFFPGMLEWEVINTKRMAVRLLWGQKSSEVSKRWNLILNHLEFYAEEKRRVTRTPMLLFVAVTVVWTLVVVTVYVGSVGEAFSVNVLAVPIILWVQIFVYGTFIARNREMVLVHQSLLDQVNDRKNDAVPRVQQVLVLKFSAKRFAKWLSGVISTSLVVIIPILMFAAYSVLIAQGECSVVVGRPRGFDFTGCSVTVQILMLLTSAIINIVFTSPVILIMVMLIMRRNSRAYHFTRWVLIIVTIAAAGVNLVLPAITFAWYGELSYSGWGFLFGIVTNVVGIVVCISAPSMRHQISFRVLWRLVLPSIMLVITAVLYTRVIMPWYAASSQKAQATFVLFLHPVLHKCGEWIVVQLGKQVFMNNDTPAAACLVPSRWFIMVVVWDCAYSVLGRVLILTVGNLALQSAILGFLALIEVSTAFSARSVVYWTDRFLHGHAHALSRYARSGLPGFERTLRTQQLSARFSIEYLTIIISAFLQIFNSIRANTPVGWSELLAFVVIQLVLEFACDTLVGFFQSVMNNRDPVSAWAKNAKITWFIQTLISITTINLLSTAIVDLFSATVSDG